MGEIYKIYIGKIPKMLAQKSTQFNNQVNKNVSNFNSNIYHKNEETKKEDIKFKNKRTHLF